MREQQQLLCVVHSRVVPINAADTAENAGIGKGKQASLYTNQIPCYLLVVRNGTQLLSN